MKFSHGPLTLLLLLVFVLAGCAPLQTLNQQLNSSTAVSRLEKYQLVEDKPLIDALYTLANDGSHEAASPSIQASGYTLEDLTATKIVFKKAMYRTHNMSEMATKMAAYQGDSENDTLSRAYFEQANQRGHHVKIYSTSLAKTINSVFKQPFQPMQHTVEWYDRDALFIEFDAVQLPVSVLVRAHQAQTSVGIHSHLYTSIYFGSANMRLLESKIQNVLFENHLLRIAHH